MPLVRSNFERRHLSPLLVGVDVTLVVGASGAVTSASGKGFETGPADKGTVVKETAAGQYTITFPGRGALQRIIPRYPVIEDTVDAHQFSVIAKSLANRSVTVQFWGPTAADDTALVETDLTSGTIVHFAFDVQETNLG